MTNQTELNEYLRGTGASKEIIDTQDGYFVANIDTIEAPIDVPTKQTGSFKLSPIKSCFNV